MRFRYNNAIGVIYIMTNPSFPGFVKIGYADDVEHRLAQLNSSECIPYAFRIYAVYEVSERLTDKELHKLIDQLNPQLRAKENIGTRRRVREFYAMSAEEAYMLLESIAGISGTSGHLRKVEPDGSLAAAPNADIQAQPQPNDNASVPTSKKQPFRFTDYGIPIGSELAFLENPSIKVTVSGPREVEYQGQRLSTSAMAAKLLNTTRAIQGTLHFTYNGKRLLDIRQEQDEANLPS